MAGATARTTVRRALVLPVAELHHGEHGQRARGDAARREDAPAASGGAAGASGGGSRHRRRAPRAAGAGASAPRDGRRGGQHRDAHAADLEHLAAPQGRRPHALPVEQGPVRRAEVLQAQAAARLRDERGVPARRAGVADHEVAPLHAAEHEGTVGPPVTSTTRPASSPERTSSHTD